MENRKIRTFLSRTFLLISMIFCAPCGYSQNIWLTPPENFDIDQVVPSFYADLRGGIYGTSLKGFEYANRNVSIFVRFLDALPDELTLTQKALFSSYKIEYEGVERLVYEYVVGTPKHEFPVKRAVPSLPAMPKYSNHTPFKSMTPKELACFIKEKNVFFFTGAGISAQGGVHTYSSLHREIGYIPEAPVDDFVKTALDYPERLIEKILMFYAAARDNPPTVAHEIIREIALCKGAQVVTSNFDRLHHRTGILPYRTMGRNVEEDLQEEWLAEVDGIITIGLGMETRHILGSYKKYNPHGVIIAINEVRPSYIGPDDYLVQGDLQEILLEVRNLYTLYAE